MKIYERFNEETNGTQYYMEYGRWYHGWLTEEEPSGPVYKIHYDTVAVQDDYTEGLPENGHRLLYNNGTLVFYHAYPQSEYLRSRFQLGLRPDLLPPIPWEPNSC